MGRPKKLDNGKAITFYLPLDIVNDLQRVAEKLHSEGAPGVLSVEGKVHKSAVVHYLINRELKGVAK